MSIYSHHVEIGARLSPFLQREFSNPAFELLRHIEVFSSQDALTAAPADDHLLLHDLVQKALLRGRSPFTSYEVERLLIGQYGAPLGLSVCPEAKSKEHSASLDYEISSALIAAYNAYSDFLSPWQGCLTDIPLDPENPRNEQRFLTHLRDVFGDRLLHCIYPQFELSVLLGEETGRDFLGQHGDFLISLPNGKALILEPGDHDTADEQVRDRQRDQAMQSIGIETVRCRNAQIGKDFVRAEVLPRLAALGAMPFLQAETRNAETDVAMKALFLLPSLVARTEWVLNDALLLRGLINRESLSMVVMDRDLPVFELALWSVIRRIQAFATLYGIQGLALPALDVTLIRERSDDFCKRLQGALRGGCQFTISPAIPDRPADLSLDLSITCNRLTPAAEQAQGLSYAVRNTFPFKQPFALRYRSRPRAIITSNDDDSEAAATTFLRDFFRKAAFRKGQWPIIRQVLQQKDTIGLLPTSAGKSICYQLAALLTPGTALVVAPTTALIDDQVQGLMESAGIDRIVGWHSGARIAPKDVGAVLGGSMILFVSPERLLRPDFRAALNSLKASDIFINYTVADEAHCVSMWGQDFRPSYLCLKYNFIEYCSFQGHKPVTVALTGTASQLVLIDLKTVLDIPSMDAIVRPKSFNRDELSFSLVKCSRADKAAVLKNQLATVAHRLGVADARKQAWGIVFAYTPKELWSLFGEFVGGADHAVQTVQTQIGGQKSPIGICTGSTPDANLLPPTQWKEYTRKTMHAMKRGDIHLLFGNATVSVGVDCDRINYVINLRMPQSMEAFYQQCGRAGRKGQPSECVLIFSDDNPAATRQWLATRENHSGDRWDDIGTVMYFHGLNFPGRDRDFTGACAILDAIIARRTMQDGRILVRRADGNTERYISYALVLGVIDDYEVTGFGANTVYRVRMHPSVIRIMDIRDVEAGRVHLCQSLHAYLSRYRHCTLQEVEARFGAVDGNTPSKKAVRVLIEFIYERIEQRRVASISTMVSYCNMQDTSPANLKKTLAAYFDRSEKFAPLLDAISDQNLAVDLVAKALDQVAEFDDVENLFWETRRFLDEQFRADFALLNLFALLYRERTLGEVASGQWRDILTELRAMPAAERSNVNRLLGIVILRIGVIGGDGDAGTGLEMVLALVEVMYDSSRLRFMDVADELEGRPMIQTAFQSGFVSKQAKEVLHASRFEQVT